MDPTDRVSVGLGARRGAGAEEVLSVIAASLASAGLPPDAVAELATVAGKAHEPGLRRAAQRLGVPLRAYGAAELAAVPVPHPAPAAARAVGTPSVAEAAALLSAGPDAELVVAKLKSTPEAGGSRVTCAVAQRRAR
ncbi:MULTISPECIES: cobalamin biosynthesis protein [unclassified Streptomyces]|uniref:cobalamin biosynthesis protein n=1 Tax=unclassified Streptomyces TaxID=2593676 RepID=UPI0022B6607B|nr:MULTISPECIES: cobalamin biosynthesis protein [unclassified Streptomyces]MCZ7413583.1 cobalamin biosynthesis protein [Streptomyces sp. WMMC897]MCZ7430578.1 cobalamin biosynthesis protein [Streptomyces sp. WMMC1477]